MPIAKAASAVTVTVAAQTSAPESIAQSLVQGANDGVIEAEAPALTTEIIDV